MTIPYISVRFDGMPYSKGQPNFNLGTPINGAQRWGVFANWSHRGGELIAETDPFGMFSLFYSASPRGVTVSPSLSMLLDLGADRTLDDRALSVFHMLGWYLDEDTPFKSIKVLPPGGRLRWKDGRLSVSGTRPEFQPIKTNRAAAIDEYARLFSAAVRSCGEAAGPYAMPLSGGRDSRHIVLEALRSDYRPEYCVTLNPLAGEGLSPDVACARQLCSELSLPHVLVRSLKSKYRDQLEAMRLTGYCSDEHSQTVNLIHHFAQSNLNFMDGIGGDVLSRNKSFSNPEASSLIASGKYADALRLHSAGLDAVTGTTFQDRIRTNFDVKVKEASEQIFSNFDQVRHAQDPNSQFVFWSRTRREIGLSPQILMGDFTRSAFCPYLEPEIVSFCSGLSQDVTSDGKFHDAIIERSFPHIKTPYDNDMRGAYPSPPLSEKVGEIIEAVAAKAALGAIPMLLEPLNQARMLLQRSRRGLAFWNSYGQALSAR